MNAMKILGNPDAFADSK